MLSVGQELEETGICQVALGLGDGSVEGGDVEEKGGLGTNGVTPAQGMMANANNEAKVREDLDKNVLADGSI